MAMGYGHGHGPWPWPWPWPWPCAHVCTQQCPKLTSKRRTDLKTCALKAKFIKESDFDVKNCLAPPKSTDNDEKPVSDIEKFAATNFRHRKIKSCKSSETRFAEVSCRLEPCSRSKRPFELRRRGGGNYQGKKFLGYAVNAYTNVLRTLCTGFRCFI